MWRLKWKQKDIEGTTEEQIEDLRSEVKSLRISNVIISGVLLTVSIIYLNRYLQIYSYYQQTLEMNQRILETLQQLSPGFERLLSELEQLLSEFRRLLSELQQFL